MSVSSVDDLVKLDTGAPVWDRFFCVAPLVLIGTRDEHGVDDLAPKHMVTPLGWDNYFGFVCSPQHSTWKNIVQTGQFTVSYPRPTQILFASLAASPRCDDKKPVVEALDTIDGFQVAAPMLADSYLFLECGLQRIVDGFGKNGLITGRIISAHVHPDALRKTDQDDQTTFTKAPLLAYINPGRFSVIAETDAFPFPADMRR